MQTTKQEGMKAVLTAQKYIPLQKEATKDGVKETRQLVLKGEFNIFVEGQQDPVKLPVKLEFKDKPGTVGLVQTALNIADTGEECLLVIHSNRRKRLDKYVEELDQQIKDQQLKFGSEATSEDDTDLDEDEDDY